MSKAMTHAAGAALAALLALGLATTSRAQGFDILVFEAEPAAEADGEPADEKRVAEAENATQRAKKRVRKENPQVAAMMKQVRPQYEALLHGRLHAIRDLCQPTPEQERALLDHGKRGMEKALRAFARHMVKHNQGNFVIGFGNARNKGPTPELDMDRAVAEAVAEHLDAEQQSKHREDQKKRVADRRRVCAAAITATLDSELLLNEEQRQQLAKNLFDNWNLDWDGCEKSIGFGPNYLPKIPAKLIKPVLDKEQQQLWRKTAQHGSFIHMGELQLIGGDPGCRIAPFRVRENDPESEPTEGAS